MLAEIRGREVARLDALLNAPRPDFMEPA